MSTKKDPKGMQRLKIYGGGRSGQTDRHTNRHTDIATYRLNRARGRFDENLEVRGKTVNLIQILLPKPSAPVLPGKRGSPDSISA